MHFHRIASVAYLARGSFIVGGRIRGKGVEGTAWMRSVGGVEGP